MLSLLLTSEKLSAAGQNYKLLKICTPHSCSCKTSGTTLLDLPEMPFLLPWATEQPLPILRNNEILAVSDWSITKHGPEQRMRVWCYNYPCNLNQPAHSNTAFNTTFNS